MEKKRFLHALDLLKKRLSEDKHPHSECYLEILSACLDRGDEAMIKSAAECALNHLESINLG